MLKNKLVHAEYKAEHTGRLLPDTENNDHTLKLPVLRTTRNIGTMHWTEYVEPP